MVMMTMTTTTPDGTTLVLDPTDGGLEAEWHESAVATYHALCRAWGGRGDVGVWHGIMMDLASKAPGREM